VEKNKFGGAAEAPPPAEPGLAEAQA